VNVCIQQVSPTLIAVDVAYRIVEVNNSLIDDGLVDKEKIGGSNYFWSFPAKKDRLIQLEHERNLQEITKLQDAIQEATTQLSDAKRGREDVDGERAKKLQRLNEIKQEKGKLAKELESLKENDPQALADLEKELKFVTDAANRWTDNIFNCKSYLLKKRGMEKKEVNRILGITAEFDCKYEVQSAYGR
jgi:Leucine zipper with capping helix domain/Mnd1 HTH domain